MLVWELPAVNEPLRLVERPDPEPGPSDVLVEIRASGLCHSDVGVCHDPGWTEVVAFWPMVIGHEFAGVVTAVGDDVQDVRVGDRVGVCPLGPSGVEPGYGRDGGFATHSVVPASDVVPIPDGVDFMAAAVGTDAGATALHAVKTVGEVRAGSRVAIVGLGGLGQFAVGIALLLGAEVLACDVRPAARELATGLGVTDVFENVSDLAGAQPDVIVDLAGFGTTTAEAIRSVAPGGRVVQVGMGVLEATISTRDLITNQVTLVGSLGASITELGEVYELLASGMLAPAITPIEFSEIPAGLERLAAGQVQGRLAAVVDATNAI